MNFFCVAVDAFYIITSFVSLFEMWPRTDEATARAPPSEKGCSCTLYARHPERAIRAKLFTFFSLVIFRGERYCFSFVALCRCWPPQIAPPPTTSTPISERQPCRTCGHDDGNAEAKWISTPIGCVQESCGILPRFISVRHSRFCNSKCLHCWRTGAASFCSVARCVRIGIKWKSHKRYWRDARIIRSIFLFQRLSESERIAKTCS